MEALSELTQSGSLKDMTVYLEKEDESRLDKLNEDMANVWDVWCRKGEKALEELKWTEMTDEITYFKEIFQNHAVAYSEIRSKRNQEAREKVKVEEVTETCEIK